MDHRFDDFLSFRRINCDEFQFFLAFFMLLGNNPPPLYVPSGLMRYMTYPYLNGIQTIVGLVGNGGAHGTLVY